jgi:hypothetical protein
VDSVGGDATALDGLLGYDAANDQSRDAGMLTKRAKIISVVLVAALFGGDA